MSYIVSNHIFDNDHTVTIVGRSGGGVGFHQDIFQTFGFPESSDGWFFEYFAQVWVFWYGCLVFTNDVG